MPNLRRAEVGYVKKTFIAEPASPVVPKRTKTLLKITGGQKTETDFRLFNDSDIGLDKKNFMDRLMEIKMDDDVDTDEDIYENAMRACSKDFNDTRYY